MLHLAYFFSLWLAIETVLLNVSAFARGPAELARLYIAGWIAPASPLWFIQLLAIFYLVTRGIRRVKPRRVLVASVLLQILAAAGLFHTGWSVADHFAANSFISTPAMSPRPCLDFAAALPAAAVTSPGRLVSGSPCTPPSSRWALRTCRSCR